MIRAMLAAGLALTAAGCGPGEPDPEGTWLGTCELTFAFETADGTVDETFDYDLQLDVTIDDETEGIAGAMERELPDDDDESPYEAIYDGTWVAPELELEHVGDDFVESYALLLSADGTRMEGEYESALSVGDQPIDYGGTCSFERAAEDE